MPDMRAENDRITRLRGHSQLLRMAAMCLRPLSSRQLARQMGAGNEASGPVRAIHVIENPKHVHHDLPSGLDRLRKVGVQALAPMSVRRVAASHTQKYNIAAEHGGYRRHHARMCAATGERRRFLQPRRSVARRFVTTRLESAPFREQVIPSFPQLGQPARRQDGAQVQVTLTLQGRKLLLGEITRYR